MAVTTFTTTTADDARLAAWATANGFANPKACIIALVKQSVEAFESGQNTATFATSYVPVAPA